MTGKALGPTMIGELLIRGPQVMMGYLNDSKTTMKVLDDDGWYHTGDLAIRSETGQFYYVDRKTQMIHYKSTNVSVFICHMIATESIKNLKKMMGFHASTAF